MKQLSCILIALTFVAVYGCNYESSKSTTGTPVKMGECPHCVSIRLYGIHFCSGNILDDRFILTTADCVSPVIDDIRLMNYFTVVAGTIHFHSGGEIHKVQKVWKYKDDYNKNYNKLSLSNPYIGVIKLVKPFIQFGPTQQPIMLPTKSLAEDDDVTIAAWGFLNLQNRQNLHKVNATIKLTNTCKKYYQNLPRHDFCILTNATNLSYCDNGSGLIRNSDKTIVGLVSRGRNLELCAMDYPYLFIPINPYLSWIKNILITDKSA